MNKKNQDTPHNLHPQTDKERRSVHRRTGWQGMKQNVGRTKQAVFPWQSPNGEDLWDQWWGLKIH